jgi:hypothetical protein
MNDASLMIERYLHHVRVELPAPDEVAAGARVRLADRFQRNALRRMTHFGLLLGSTLDGMVLGPDDAVVFASTFSETRALEDFLTGFPAASPLLFQTSIHPGAVQQVLIGRQQPIARLWPLAGRTRLVEQALLTALLEPAGRVAVVGGEERGTWMLEQGMASARAFAFATLLSRETVGAVGRVAFSPGSPGSEAGPALEEFAHALAERRVLQWAGAQGAWTIDWR